MRPGIGITLSPDAETAGRFTLRQDYVRAVEQAGGLPLVFAPTRPEAAGELLDRVEGLLLSGGSDIDPALYGAPPHAKLGPLSRDRDEFEISLAREALRRDLPILAICRGQQVLNVATGGTLFQDIPSQVEGAMDHDPKVERWEVSHDVRVLPGTRLREILGRETVQVNSFHHQAVKDLGDGLLCSARAADGVIEGVEAPAKRFVLGVQWHPEAFWAQTETFAKLFQAFVRAGGAS
jgi:putative glutamine amidotransferase